MTPSDIPCVVPGCGLGRVTEDCCLTHSLMSNEGGGKSLHNDGIVDWLAVEIAASGTRQVQLTWVEKDIAAGVMFARGYGAEEIENRTGARVCGVPTSRRVLAARKIAESGVLERLEAELGGP